MRTLDLDWESALSDLASWQTLSFEAQAFCLAGPPSDSAEASVLAEDLCKELIASGWCEFSGDRQRIQRSPERRAILSALRAMVRAPVLHAAADDRAYSRRDAEGTSLDNYLVEHCSEQDLQRLGNLQAEGRLHIAAKLASSSWVLAFLRREQPGALAPRRRDRYAKVKADVLELSEKLIRVLLEQGEPWALADAYETFVESPLAPPRGSRLRKEQRVARRRFAQALHFTLREALVLISLDDELNPFLGLWPNAVRSIRRRQAAENVDAVASGEPTDTWLRPQLADDLVVLLTECASQPPRIKANHRELFAKASRELTAQLAPPPAWLEDNGFQTTPAERLQRALNSAIGFGLATAAGAAGKDLRLILTGTGREWLNRDAAERLTDLILWLREDRGVRGAVGSRDTEKRWEESEDFDEGAFTVTRLLPHRPYHYFLWNVDFTTPTLDAYRQLERTGGQTSAQRGGKAASGAWYDIERFLQQKAALNPIEEHLSPERLRWLGEQEAGRMWFMVLATFFFERLVATGGAEIGLIDGRLVFRLASPADVLLGVADELVLPAPESGERVVIQPNFEVVFLTPAPQAAAEFSRIAERRFEGHLGDRVGTLFELTKASIQRSASTGVSGQQILEQLARLSTESVPENVAQQVKLWCADLHWVRPRRLTVLECRTAEATAAVLGALGRSASLLGEGIVEIDTARLSEAQRRRLRESGVFLEES